MLKSPSTSSASISALESTLARELDFIDRDSVAVLADARGQTVVLELPREVLTWVELGGVCEQVVEIATAGVGRTTAVWLVRDGGLPRATASRAIDRERIADGLASDALPWLAKFRDGVLELPSVADDVGTGTALELAGFAQELLSGAAIAPSDHLFGRGADSLTCVRLIARVRDRWGVTLEPRDIFDAPRIDELAARIDALRAHATPPIEVPQVDRSKTQPLSAAQARIWLVSQLEGAGPAQNVTGGLRLRGELDLDALRRAAQRLTQRHELLRASIVVEIGQPVLRIAPELPITVAVRRLEASADQHATSPFEELPDVFARGVREAAEAPFDLERGPLWRFELHVLGRNDHQLVLCMHHVISDGWSMELAARELLQLYAAELAGSMVGGLSAARPVASRARQRTEDSPAIVLPELPFQFLDVAAWEAQRLAAGRSAQQLEYWREKLGDEHVPLELPSARAVKQRSGRAGRTVAIDFTPDQGAALRALAAEQCSTLFVVLLSAFQLWLSRITGREDIRVGVPVLGRSLPGSENLIGCFINTLVVGTRLQAGWDARALVRDVDSTLRAALANGDIPFDALVKALAPERAADHNPLFQVTYNHLRIVQSSFEEAARFTGLEVERLAREPVGSPFILSLETEEDDRGGLRAVFNYPVESFEPGTVRELAESFVRLLDQLASKPESRVELHELVSPQLFDTLSAPHAANRSPRESTRSAYVHERILRHALARPGAISLIGAGERWTFQELESCSRGLALRLRELGVGAEVRVGILAPRGPRMIAASLGVLRAGGAFVPLDPNYPAAHLEFMLQDSQLRVLLVDELASDEGQRWPNRVVRIALSDVLDPAPPDAVELAPAIHPEQSAYVIYTSGSTGRPKGVAVSHGSLASHCAAVGALYDMTERDCALHFASFSFDAAVEQWTTPLAHGASVVVGEAGSWTGAQTYEVVRREAVSIVYPPTSALRSLAQHVLGTEGARGDTRSLVRAVCVGGEAVSREDYALITKALRPERFINGYGPTECVVTPLLWRSFGDLTPESSYTPIGRAVGDRRVYVLDRELMPVPIGVLGEIYIARGLARGYNARPAATAESFVPDPWSSERGGRMYRTGDFGRWLPNGDVEYVGRRDQQVKVRGFRIELGEIEARLREHPEVRDAVVLAQANADGHSRLVGYVAAPGSDEAQLTAALRSKLAIQLPEHMVPAQLAVLAVLPQTPNGKVDRRALAALELEPARTYAPPETDAERLLAKIWCDVLGLACAGVDDNFFELGGDSIIALQVVSRAREAGYALSPKQLFVHQTVRALALALPEPESRIGVEVEPVRAQVPLSPIQRVFFATSPAPNHYNQALVLRPRSELDPASLESALAAVGEHHDALRLRFAQAEGGAIEQSYAERASWRLEFHAGPVSEREFERIGDRLQRSFDLARGPIAAAALVRIEPGGERLVLAIHHLAVDAVSWRVLLEDLETAYLQLVRGDSVVLPARTTPFRVWSERLHALAQSDVLANELEFWASQVDARGPELPRDTVIGSSGSVAAAQLELSEADTKLFLRRVPETYRTQVNDILLVALARVVCRWAQRDSISIALEGHGRESASVPGGDELDLSRTVGWFTSVFPVRLSPMLGADAASIAAAIKGVKEQLRAVPRRGLGFAVLQQLSAALVGAPTPRVSFNYLGQLDRTFDASSLFALATERCGESQDEETPLPAWLNVEGCVSAGRLSLQITYGSEMYRAETIATLAAAYREELLHIIAHCSDARAGGVTPSDFPLSHATQAELDRLPIAAREVQELYPLSPLQQGMLFHSVFDQAQHASGDYVSQLTVDLAGLDVPRFVRAWQDAVDRHTILRTAFVELAPGSGFLQLVRTRAALPVTELDWLAVDADEGPLAELARTERGRGFDLASAPLLRLVLVRRSVAEHRLILTHHHALLDGWSLTRLFEEVLRGYAGESVPAARAPYGSYVAWLLERDTRADEAFWKGRVLRLSEPTLIAGALPLPQHAKGESIATTVQWSAAETRAFSDFSKRTRVTANTLVQAAWALLLQRCTGRSSLAFGVTVAGRPPELAGSQTAVGLFINTVPLVVELSPERSVSEWLRDLQNENLALGEHEHTALSDIQRWAGLPGRALFDTLVVFENYPVDRALAQRGGDLLRVLAVDSFDQTHYAVTLEVRLGDQLRLSFKSSDQRVAPAQLDRLAAWFSELLRELVASPERRLGALGSSGAAYRDQVERWNAAPVSLVDDRLVHELIEAQARTNPNACAVGAGSSSLSYAELDARAEHVAHVLRAAGVGPDVLVGVCLQRSLDLVVALLAILKAGGAYLPLDPTYPRDRLRFMIDDSGCVLVLTQDAVLEHLPLSTADRVLNLDRPLPASEVSERLSPRAATRDTHLAYCIYTSGSTGRPKGVELTHWGFRNYVRWALGAYRVAEIDASALHSSIAFDLTVTSLWLPLCAGKRVELVPEGGDALEDLAGLVQQLDARGATSLLKLTPSHALALAQLVHRPLPNVRAFVVGGEALSWECVALLGRIAPNARVLNEYGPTEAVVGCAIHDARSDLESSHSSVPIGRPIDNARLYVLDACLSPLPAGVAGELYIGGEALARSYRGRPGLSAERFVPDPFSAGGERLYRTGDLARFLPDGTLEYLGRIDHQIKLRGYRIELGEIEAALRADRRVQDAVVVAYEAGATRLVAYVAAGVPSLDSAARATGEATLARELDLQLRERLPEYMLPAQLIVLDALPLTPNGKVDRRALPAPDAARGESRAPSTALEAQLLAIWRAVLHSADLGVDDDFFAHGGDSIACLQVISRAREQGLSIRAKQIFDARTVAKLAASLRDHETARELDPIPQATREGWLPLTAAQERLWFLAQLEPDSPAYNISGALRLSGSLDVARLRDCFTQLVQRHEPLRTRFEEHAGRGTQRIHAEVELAFRELDVRGPDGELRAREAAAAEALSPFALADDSLLRVLLVRVSAHEHVLVVTLHHLIADGVTLTVLTDELCALYAGDSLPEPSRLQYADYAAWQQSAASLAARSRELAYFREQLGDEHPVLELPVDRPRPAAQSFRGAMQVFTLDAEQSAAVMQRGRELGVTPFMLLLAVFESVLYRWTGERDLRIGVPVSTRSRVELERIAGLFVNTLVLPARLSGALRFVELLSQVRETTLGAQAHSDLPFEQLVEALQPARSLSHNPLFQVMFDHQRAPLEGVRRLGELKVARFEGGERATQLDLTLDTVEDAGQLHATFTYAADLFEPSTIEALARRYQRVLAHVIADPQVRLAALPWLDARERAMLATGAAPAVTAGSDFIHVAIAEQARLRPETIALQGELEADRWTYARLERSSNHWAHALVRAGVRAEDRVGLYTSRSPRMVVGALAILKAGGAYVPLDPADPIERLRERVVDAGLRTIVAERSQPLAAELGVRCVWFDAAEVTEVLPPRVALSGDNLAYVIYTSGSTGRPKGVGVSHGALAQHVFAAGAHYGTTPNDVALHFSSMSFDAGVEQWACPLAHGARLVVRGDALWTLEHALAVLREEAVTFIDLPPAYLRDLASTALARGESLAVRVCLSGGEALPRESVSTIVRAAPHARLINAYGPTEAVVTPLAWSPTQGSTCTTSYAPIGRELGARRAYVLDADLNLVSPGLRGELYVGGACLARGYVERAALTAERFVPDPFSAAPGARMYRTGDHVRRLADGSLEYLGRADQQVKLRGFRVELGEVEARLAALPGVREAAVVAEGGSVANRLLGYVAGDASELDVDALRAQLLAANPEHLVPAHIVVLAELPRTRSGKLDRKLLPAPESAYTLYREPHTELERRLCAIVATVLGVERVGLDDNFFSLGGDSIRSLQVISRAREFGLVLTPRDLFERQTVAQLASAAVRVQPDEEPLRAVPRTTNVFPVSYAQERLWFLAQLEPDSAAYNLPGAVRIRGAFDLVALQTALELLVDRHESLRTTFDTADGRPRQVVHPSLALPVELHDLRAQTLERAESRARELVESLAHAAFDLARGPLLRVAAVRLPDGELVLALVVHHIICDASSLDVAIAELSALYLRTQRTAAKPAGLPALPLQYPDYVLWQRQRTGGAELVRQLEYWRTELGSEHPVLALPADHPRPRTPSRRGGVVHFEIDASLARRLRGFAQTASATPFVVLLSAWQTLLYRLSGQREIRVGVPVSLRDRRQTERVIGMFLNTQIMRAELDPASSFEDIVRSTRGRVLGAQANQDLPFERLVEELAPARSLAHNPLFQVAYNHLRQSEGPFAQSPDLQVQPFEWSRHDAQFDLSLDTEEDESGGFAARLTYATDLFERASVERWARQFVRLLELTLERPRLALGAVPWLEPDDRAALLDAGARRQILPSSGLVHERIRLQAELHRARVACSYEGERLSYGALELRANQWAHRLRSLGIGPEVRVGLCVDRSLDLVVGILAILKAGGAYVPMDPAAPSDRLAYMIRDSQVPLVLTQARYSERFAGLDALQVRFLDGEDVRGEPIDAPQVDVQPDHLAYVIYTSGSTGAPKGGLLTHRNVTRLFDATAHWFGFSERDVWTLFHSYAFDFSVWELFGALLYGGSVVVVPHEVSRSPEDFYALLRAERVTVLNQTPSAFRQLSAAACAAPESDRLALRFVIFGGEALEPAMVAPWFERFGDQRPALINMYGITETTVHVTHRQLRKADLERPASSPIGEPIPDLSLYVLDDALEPCGWGTTGELYVGGDGLARGYLDRPALTAERFVPNPFGPGRLYRSGDLAVRRGDGSLEYLGRSDHQVKIRGFRIELGEIGARLQSHADVRGTVVIARTSVSGPRLVGYVTLHVPESPELFDALKTHLRAALPEYMVPALLIALPELPLTVNGKLDRSRLPEQAEHAQQYLAPRTPLETELAQLWAELLGVSRVGADDDFFALGGHSLLVAQLASRIQQRFGVTLALRELFEATTVQALAERIAGQTAEESVESKLDALDALLTDLENES